MFALVTPILEKQLFVNIVSNEAEVVVILVLGGLNLQNVHHYLLYDLVGKEDIEVPVVLLLLFICIQWVIEN